MSCMMSSPALLSALAETVEYIGNGNYDAIGFDLPDSLIKALRNCRNIYKEYDGDMIYDKLYALNVAAYNERWKYAKEPEEAPERPRGKRLVPIYAGHTGGSNGHFIVDPLHYDLARCLDFFAYQCREDATYNTDLYKGMNDLSIVVARFIVRNSDGYTKSRWGEV